MDPVLPEGLASLDEYQFPEQHANTIIEMLTYYNNRCRSTVIWFSIYEYPVVRGSMIESFPRTSNVTLGRLGQLPQELLIVVLESLDIYSLFKLRQVSLKCREVVGSLPYRKYQRVVEHGYILFRALFQTRLATKVPLIDFDNALCTEACAICGEFSGFISILAWKRCCFSCLQRAPELRMQSLAKAREEFQLTESQLAQLDFFQVLPGTYTFQNNSQPKRRYITVSTHQASMVSGRPPRMLASWEQSIKDNFMASCVLPFYNRRPDEGRSVVEHGLSCLGCYYAQSQVEGVVNLTETAENLYTKDGFLRHFRWCEQAQILWEWIKAGKKVPEAVRITKIGGLEVAR